VEFKSSKFCAVGKRYSPRVAFRIALPIVPNLEGFNCSFSGRARTDCIVFLEYFRDRLFFFVLDIPVGVY
jgi:hypothetical protein